MSVRAHPRFLRRRATVREHRARRHLRRALWVLTIVAAAWGLAWVAQSPLFSVASIEVVGARHAAVAEILDANRVYEGRPLVLIRSGRVAEALAADPWVKDASVHRRFPDQIEVRLIEREEVVAVPAADGWRTVSDDGRIMQTVAAAPAQLATVSREVAVAGSIGEEVTDRLAGVVEFVAAVPPDLRGPLSIGMAGTELVAYVNGHRVRLGDPSNMAAKAAALVAVLGDPRLGDGQLIDLIAPARPAVRPAPSPISPEA